MIEEKLDIKNMIYEIRGKQVMFDSDLAKLYQVETKVFMQSVKRNIKRFPDNFMFQLNNEEYLSLRSQFVTSNRGGRKYRPYVFTEQGVSMLASVLHSNLAIEISIKIINSFVEMRKYISSNLLEHDNDIKILKETFNSFKEKRSHIFFEGQIYDAYSLMLDIFNKSKKEIIIIDNYLDKMLLDILCKTNKKVIVITNKYNTEDYNKYKKEYSNVRLIVNNCFHDRFIILDRDILYHCGASFKDLGNKCFCISKIIEEDNLKDLLKKMNI